MAEPKFARIEYNQKCTDGVLRPFRIDMSEDDKGVGVCLLYSRSPSKEDLDRIWSGLDKIIRNRYGGYLGFRDIRSVGLADRIIACQNPDRMYELFIHFCEP